MKKFFIIIAIGIVVLIGWYFFFKPYDYQVMFSTPTSKGTVFEGLKKWQENFDRKKDSSIAITNTNPFESFTQQLHVKDSLITMRWELSSVNDSVTEVKLFVKDENNSVANKVDVITGDATIKEIALKKVQNFRSGFKSHIQEFKIDSVSLGETPSFFCIYKTIHTTVDRKAFEMMQTNPQIMEFLNEHQLQLIHKPFTQFTKYNKNNDSITFNFCFPIQKTDSLPTLINSLKYGETKRKKALKAIFHGNYVISDHAWYTLFDYANNHDIAVNELPLEIYFNDPHMGGKELGWKAEIYMPLKDQED
ncbi:hypothetical protein ACG2LH_09375 [Zhouia sp. PK063]|uniref:hypothetical protein n=1 Tax=Zhouia sp. PK063 TaxID=3373602 RepID=UPI0037872A6B